MTDCIVPMDEFTDVMMDNFVFGTISEGDDMIVIEYGHLGHIDI